MTSLIVEFPDHTRHYSSSSDACDRKTNKKSVQFFPMQEIKFTELIDEAHVNSLWYSHNDYKAMRIAIKEDVQCVRSRSRTSNNHMKDLDEGMLTGIEKLLTPTLIKKTRACRAQCKGAVLDEQEKQYRSGVYDPISIASVSKKCSESCAKRARKIGILQFG